MLLPELVVTNSPDPIIRDSVLFGQFLCGEALVGTLNRINDPLRDLLSFGSSTTPFDLLTERLPFRLLDCDGLVYPKQSCNCFFSYSDFG